MKAVKLNRVYTITEPEMKSYIQQGYDIIDDKGVVIAYGAGKVVSFEKHVKILKAYEECLKEKDALENEIVDLKIKIDALEKELTKPKRTMKKSEKSED